MLHLFSFSDRQGKSRKERPCGIVEERQSRSSWRGQGEAKPFLAGLRGKALTHERIHHAALLCGV